MPRLCRILLAILAAAHALGSARADNWERFRGPNGSGISDDKNIPVKFGATENVRWKLKLPGDGNGSPIVWGDRVFLQSSALDGSSRSLLCIDAKKGEILWQQTIAANKVKFRQDSSHASATPATDGQAVYIPFWDGKDVILYAYDFNGNKLWNRNLGEFVSQHGAGASPVVYKDLVIFSVDKDAHFDTVKQDKLVPNPSTLYAFDRKTGKTVWETPREAIRACYSMPFILERPGVGPELMVTSSSAVTSYDPLTGKSNWYWTWKFAKGPLRTIAASTYVDGMLLSCSGDGSGERLMVGVELKGNGKDVQPEQTWSNGKFKEPPYVPCPLVRGKHAYLITDLGSAACIDAKTGEKMWFQKLPDAKFYSSPVMIDGKIYAPSEAGDVYVINAEPKYKLLATNSLGDVTRASPAVANGSLYIRTKAYLYCIGAK